LLETRERVICAIEGGCASGKTTLAAKIKKAYGCNVFPMDEFFLRPFQRTAERLSEPGGNVDYERFYEEIIKPLLLGNPFTYRPYDCSGQELADEIHIKPHRLNIVEGVYSMHPRLMKAYDLKIFLEIDEQTRKDRLLLRNKDLYGRFINEWMPMENAYFTIFQIKSLCDIIL